MTHKKEESTGVDSYRD